MNGQKTEHMAPLGAKGLGCQANGPITVLVPYIATHFRFRGTLGDMTGGGGDSKMLR